MDAEMKCVNCGFDSNETASPHENASQDRVILSRCSNCLKAIYRYDPPVTHGKEDIWFHAHNFNHRCVTERTADK